MVVWIDSNEQDGGGKLDIPAGDTKFERPVVPEGIKKKMKNSEVSCA